jgi:hypothetical protein
MIWLSTENRERAIHLLEHNDSSEFMRKGKWPEAPAGVGPRNQSAIQPCGASNYQAQGPSGEQPPLQLTGQLPAGPAGALSRQSHHGAAVNDAGFEAGGFFSPLGGDGGSPAGFPNLVLDG